MLCLVFRQALSWSAWQVGVIFLEPVYGAGWPLTGRWDIPKQKGLEQSALPALL